MKLTDFQQFIKDEEIEADKGVFESKCFISNLEKEYNGVYQDLRSTIEGSLDMSELVGYSLDFTTDKSWEVVEAMIALRVNELINTTQEEIEQFRIDSQIDDEPCDIESFKRDRELN